ncbi:hypothetical protein A2165_02925 [Candidatus Curtissbacteria bacterium RBG_13_40_7]|uniref:Response regulatory domain-containing protein n=1 Tax=Candidatus Curtissbacteria bacterium RBG_13_40_7 TaxID=1797706 RepID=A0A1F5FX31_9BACT|nr:MAG: hypothetical protein A2165_02925 [Candidatus Curtissbacteria bacterium RBG_13_40_7]
MAKIIIVEDDLQLAETYKKRLEEDGYQVIVSEDINAVDQIRNQKPDLTLLDILMPKVSGLTILRELKTDPDLEGIPVLILSNIEGAGELSQAISLGASGYLVKADTNIDTLSAKVKEVLASGALASGIKS